MTRAIRIAVLALLVAGGLVAQTQPPRRPLIRRGEALAGLGLLVATFAADKSIRDFVQDHRSSTTDRLGDIGNTLGDKFIVAPALGALYLGAALTHASGLERATLRAAEAGLIASTANAVVKLGFGRARPDLRPDDPDFFQPFKFSDNSFASGHTALAFALATSFASDTKSTAVRLSLYSLASLTAFARIDFDRHWTSDVLAGAALGIVAGRLIHRLERVRVAPAPTGLSIQIPF